MKTRIYKSIRGVIALFLALMFAVIAGCGGSSSGPKITKINRAGPNVRRDKEDTPQYRFLKCKINAEWLAKAVLAYKQENGAYPPSLRHLLNDYVEKIPPCTETGKVEWKYSVSDKGGRFTLFCSGANHVKAGVSADRPRFTSEILEENRKEDKATFLKLLSKEKERLKSGKYDAVSAEFEKEMGDIHNFTRGRRLTLWEEKKIRLYLDFCEQVKKSDKLTQGKRSELLKELSANEVSAARNRNEYLKKNHWGYKIPEPEEVDGKTAKQRLKECRKQLEEASFQLVLPEYHNNRQYPRSLGRFKIPKCPAVDEKTYEYEVSSNRERFTFYCKGHNHKWAGVLPNRPVFTNKDFEEIYVSDKDRVKRTLAKADGASYERKYNRLKKDIDRMEVLMKAIGDKRLSEEDRRKLFEYKKYIWSAIRKPEYSAAFKEDLKRFMPRIREIESLDEQKAKKDEFARVYRKHMVKRWEEMKRREKEKWSASKEKETSKNEYSLYINKAFAMKSKLMNMRKILQAGGKLTNSQEKELSQALMYCVSAKTSGEVSKGEGKNLEPILNLIREIYKMKNKK